MTDDPKCNYCEDPLETDEEIAAGRHTECEGAEEPEGGGEEEEDDPE